MAGPEALRSYRAKHVFDFGPQVATTLTPGNVGAWARFAGILLFAISVGFMAAATLAVRSGLVSVPAAEPGA